MKFAEFFFKRSDVNVDRPLEHDDVSAQGGVDQFGLWSTFNLPIDLSAL